MTEEYRTCFEDYEISNFGNCRRKLKNGKYRIIKGSILNRGYRYFQISRGGKRTNFLFHQMVAKCFIGGRPEKYHTDHIDRNKLNNHVDNLRYVTPIENMRNCDRYRDDIKEQGKERVRILYNENYKRIKKSKKYVCETCPLVCSVSGLFGGSYEHKIHMNSKHHLKRIKIINKMKELNLEINEKMYNTILNQNYDFKRGRQTKRLININEL